MADIASLKQKVTTLVDNVKYYWKEPPKGRYMSFKEIGSYAFGGIGAYLIVSMSYICMLATTNVYLVCYCNCRKYSAYGIACNNC